jgi:hypothetical protein
MRESMHGGEVSITGSLRRLAGAAIAVSRCPALSPS